MTGQLNSHMFEEVYEKLGINLNKLGCIMLDLENPDDKIYVHERYLHKSPNPERKWINGWVMGKTPHITLLYGLMDNGHIWKEHVEAVLKGWKLDEVEIESFDRFDSPYEDEEYYCVVAHIKMTPELMEGHQRLEFLPHINTFNGYKPHMTVCYIKKNDVILANTLELLNKNLAGKKLKIKPGINLGYEPDEN